MSYYGIYNARHPIQSLSFHVHSGLHLIHLANTRSIRSTTLSPSLPPPLTPQPICPHHLNAAFLVTAKKVNDHNCLISDSMSLCISPTPLPFPQHLKKERQHTSSATPRRWRQCPERRELKASIHIFPRPHLRGKVRGIGLDRIPQRIIRLIDISMDR